MSSRPRRNLELKARCADLASARRVVEQLGARSGGTEIQTDTYFHVAHGRLKLREIESQAAFLISYDRPDHDAARISAYHLVPVADADGLKAALAAALGVRGQVRKRRQIYFWHNVRIHLDEIDGLGSFVEFEAVLSSEQDESESAAHLEMLRHSLALEPADLISRSYADLLGLTPPSAARQAGPP
jgi:predicted adenylyl cyclase CyaB